VTDDDYLSTLVVYHDIVRLDVAVHDTHTVTIIKRLTHTALTDYYTPSVMSTQSHQTDRIVWSHTRNRETVSSFKTAL